jgi:hypothetical protein
MQRVRPWLFAVFVLGYVLLSAGPAWLKVKNAKHGRDYATYHYAAAQALDGASPYDTKALSKRARAEKTRKSVHPYFYPPPFLLSVLWSPNFSLSTASKAFFGLNQLALLGCVAVFRLWFRAPWMVLGVLALSFTPITDNAKMGQANVLVMFAAILGLWLRQGAAVGAAAMAKMSPALYLFGFAAQRAWRPIVAAIAVAVGSSVLVLPWVDLATQWQFYTEILPGFSTGHYHGLTVKIGLPANHSIPDLFNQLWPGPTRHALSGEAQLASKLTSVTLLGMLCWLGRHRREPLGEAGLFGAFTVLSLITPVYTYEHHLVVALFPAVVVGTALLDGRLGRLGWFVGLPAIFFTGWPLYWLRPLQKLLPDLHWWLQESKFFGLIGLGVLCAVTALNSPRARE